MAETRASPRQRARSQSASLVYEKQSEMASVRPDEVLTSGADDTSTLISTSGTVLWSAAHAARRSRCRLATSPRPCARTAVRSRCCAAPRGSLRVRARATQALLEPPDGRGGDGGDRASPRGRAARPRGRVPAATSSGAATSRGTAATARSTRRACCATAASARRTTSVTRSTSTAR